MDLLQAICYAFPVMCTVLHLFLLALLPLKSLKLGEESLLVEVASTNKTREEGLMGRRALREDRGMLFIFPEAQVLSFWMKNTLIPLSIGFFDEEKKLFQVIDMPVPRKAGPFPLFQSTRPARYALEVPYGWFQEHGICEGVIFSFPDCPP